LAVDPVADEVPPRVVTVTTTTPALSAGEVAVIEVGELTVTNVDAVVPNLTVAPVTNPVPVMVTMVPPAVVPEAGLSDVTVGVTS
jgi:hypothetical protein